MTQLITAIARRARKPHRDDSADFIIEAMEYIRFGAFPGEYGNSPWHKMTFTELRAIAKLKANKWMILPGQLYTRQYNRNDEGGTFTFKTLPDILKICLKYKLYGDV